jgi:hypothetical protein
MLAAGAGLAQPQATNPPAPTAAPAQPEPQPAPPPPSQPQVQAPVPVRVVDQPMTVRTEGPLPVKVIETPKSDAQFNAEQHERVERSLLYDQLLIYAALLVAVVAFLAIAFAVQTLYLGLGLRSLRRVAQRGERNVQAAQRAFVYTSSLDWAPVGDSVRISPIWANSGTTPTRRLRIATNWKASHGELPADFDINYVRAPESLFLGPNSNAEFGTLLIPMRDIQAAIEERLHLYVWGRATYEDLFRDSQPHHFNFCHRIEAAGATPDRIELRFGQFGLSNGSDEDSRKADERD